MGKAQGFSNLYNNKMIRKGSYIRLIFDIENIPTNSIVEVTSFEKKDNKIFLEIESIDGSKVKISYDEDKFPHEVVK